MTGGYKLASGNDNGGGGGGGGGVGRPTPCRARIDSPRARKADKHPATTLPLALDVSPRRDDIPHASFTRSGFRSNESTASGEGRRGSGTTRWTIREIDQSVRANDKTSRDRPNVQRTNSRSRPTSSPSPRFDSRGYRVNNRPRDPSARSPCPLTSSPPLPREPVKHPEGRNPRDRHTFPHVRARINGLTFTSTLSSPLVIYPPSVALSSCLGDLPRHLDGTAPALLRNLHVVVVVVVAAMTTMAMAIPAR